MKKGTEHCKDCIREIATKDAKGTKITLPKKVPTQWQQMTECIKKLQPKCKKLQKVIIKTNKMYVERFQGKPSRTT